MESPLLLMTGAPLASLGERVKDAQPLGFLAKPYTEADVERALIAAVAQLPLQI